LKFGFFLINFSGFWEKLVKNRTAKLVQNSDIFVELQFSPSHIFGRRMEKKAKINKEKSTFLRHT